MTVDELILLLEDCDPDAQVYVQGGQGLSPATGVEVIGDFIEIARDWNGDPGT